MLSVTSAPPIRTPTTRARRALVIFGWTCHQERTARQFPTALAQLFSGPDLAALHQDVCDVHVFGDDSISSAGRVYRHDQQGNDFRTRLLHAAHTVAGMGYASVVLIGTDCPSLDARTITTAFEHLDTHAAVLGPDHRGGTYLIGLRSELAARLNRIVWRENTDFAQLQAVLADQQVATLRTLIDVDRWRDVALLADTATPLRAWLRRLLAQWLSPCRFTSEFYVDVSRLRELRRHHTSPPVAVA